MSVCDAATNGSRFYEVGWLSRHVRSTSTEQVDPDDWLRTPHHDLLRVDWLQTLQRTRQGRI